MVTCRGEIDQLEETGHANKFQIDDSCYGYTSDTCWRGGKLDGSRTGFEILWYGFEIILVPTLFVSFGHVIMTAF